MKRAALIFISLIALTLVGTVLAFNAGLFHSTIEQKVAEASGAKVHLGTIQLLYRWPITLHVGQSTIQHPLADVSWRKADLEVRGLSEPYDLMAVLDQLAVEMKPTQAANPGPSAPASPNSKANAPVKVSIDLEIKNGVIRTPWATVGELNLRFVQKRLMRTPASIHGTAAIHTAFLPVRLPLKIDTDTLTFSEETVKTSALTVALGGLNANVQGTSLLKESRHRWLLDISAKDLSLLPPPPPEFGAKKWTGSIQLHAEVSKDAANKPWQAEGSVQAVNVSAEVQMKQDLLTIKGPFLLNAGGKFSYLNEKISLPGLKASLDLSNAQVVYADILSKAPGVVMRAQTQASGDNEKVNIQQLDLQLWNFFAQVNGGVQVKAPFPANLHFSLKPVNLEGAEKLLLPLSKSPVQGEVSVKGTFNGALTDPLRSRVNIENFQMRKFSGIVEYEKPGMFGIRGPASADLQAQGEWSDEKVKFARAKGSIDLSAASLVAGPLRKEGKALMRAALNVHSQLNSVVIDEMELNTFFGNFGVKGKAEVQLVPTLDLVLEAKPLNLSELRIAVPSFRDLLPKGQVSGRVQVSGRADFTKTWNNWPLLMSGNISAKLPQYKMMASDESSAPPAGVGGPTKSVSTAFLPDGEFTRRLKLAIQADIAEFTKDTLEAKGLHAEGQIAQGKFAGTVSINQVFGGSVTVKNLNVPLLQQKPVIQGTASWSNLTIEDAVGFAKPEYRKMAEGKIAGQAEFSTHMPSEENFMKALRVRGNATAEPVTVNSLKVGQMINDALAKVPMLKLKPVKVEPLKGQIKAQFDLNAGTLDLPALTALDTNNSEIQMKGKVALSSMQGDLAGTFFWSQSQVKGCLLEGNSDAQGRMVVPLALKGDLMNPSFSVLSDLVTKMGSKALDCEQKKFVEKVKTQGKEQLEKELKKTLKNILGN